MQKLIKVGCLETCFDATIVATAIGSPTIPPEICRARNTPVTAVLGFAIVKEFEVGRDGRY
jgi:hypothetical protein